MRPLVVSIVVARLGLKLTSAKESLPVVVIDRAEQPTEN